MSDEQTVEVAQEIVDEAKAESTSNLIARVVKNLISVNAAALAGGEEGVKERLEEAMTEYEAACRVLGAETIPESEKPPTYEEMKEEMGELRMKAILAANELNERIPPRPKEGWDG